MSLVLYQHPFAAFCQAGKTLEAAYAVLDAQLADRKWTAGPKFGLADCAAAPALFYARVVHRWEESRHANVTRYYRDLAERASVARVIDEARPRRDIFPLPWPSDTDGHGGSRPGHTTTS